LLDMAVGLLGDCPQALHAAVPDRN
jgi:hypothetical protein